MKKAFITIISVIGYILLVWAIISFIDVNLHNSAIEKDCANWNFFKIISSLWKGVDKMKKQSVYERRFKCPTCGYIATAFKKSSRRTAEKHLKNMYCPFCKNEHNFIQLSRYE